MNIGIVENGNSDFIVTLEGEFFRHCKTYSELATTIGSLVKSRYKGDLEGFI